MKVYMLYEEYTEYPVIKHISSEQVITPESFEQPIKLTMILDKIFFLLHLDIRTISFLMRFLSK